MPIISTYGTFSVRGFGGFGSGSTPPPPPGAAHIGYVTNTDGFIFDIIIDSSNNIIGIYNNDTAPTGGRYLFKYGPTTSLIYWLFEDTGTRSYVLAQDSSGNIYGAGSISLYTVGTKYGTLTSYGTGVPSWGRRYSYVINSPYDASNLPNFNNIAVVGTTVVGMGVKDQGTGTREAWIARPDTSGSLDPSEGMPYYTYNYSASTGVAPYIINGGCAALEVASPALCGFGTFDSTYGILTYKRSSTTYIRKLFDDTAGSYAYVATSTTGGGNTYIGIARVLKSTRTVSNSYTFATSGTSNEVTGFYVDTTNSYIYISYTSLTEASVDRITKFSINGTPVWTRTLKQASGAALGIKKIISSPDGSRYYLLNDTTIFEFATDGSIPSPGSYTVDGITYTYANSGTAWTNGTTSNFALASLVFTEYASYPDTATSSSLSVSSSIDTSEIAWAGIG